MSDLNDVFRTMGASNHADSVREENDYYATDPAAVDALLSAVDLVGDVWEPACGGGHLSGALEARGFSVLSTDLVDRGYGCGGVDFLACRARFDGNVVTNPPYKYAEAFVRHALELVPDGKLVCMLLKLTFLEGKGRRALFDTYPPERVLVFSNRLLCAKNGEFERMRAGGGGIQAYAWFVWRKGWTGETRLGWVN